MNRQDWAIARSTIRRQLEGRSMRSSWTHGERTLADDLRDNPRPIDTAPHAHFHSHGGSIHVHDHIHPDDHAHSSRFDEPAHDAMNEPRLDEPDLNREGDPAFNGAF